MLLARPRRRELPALPDVPTSAPVRPGAEPYAGGSGDVGVLLLHGFTGSPVSLVPWAQHLERAGYRVRVPRLPGHGTRWQELNRTTWTDWYGAVEDAFVALRADTEQVFVGGLSMGGALALRLAARHGPAVAGLVLVNTAINHLDLRLRVLPMLQRLVTSLPAIGNDIARPGQDEGADDRTPLRALHSQTRLWAEVRREVPRVDQPLLVYTSATDHVVDPSSLELVTSRVGSADRTFVTLTRSYHVATLDHEAADIFEGSVAFFRRLATSRSSATGTAAED